MLEGEIPFTELSLPLPVPIADVLVSGGACESKGEAKRVIKQGGVSLNDTRAEEGSVISEDDLLCGKYLFIRLGKKRFHLVAFNSAG